MGKEKHNEAEGNKEFIRIEVLWDKEKGGITVNGPLEDKILCYGLLEYAKEVVRDFKAK